MLLWWNLLQNPTPYKELCSRICDFVFSAENICINISFPNTHMSRTISLKISWEWSLRIAGFVVNEAVDNYPRNICNMHVYLYSSFFFLYTAIGISNITSILQKYMEIMEVYTETRKLHVLFHSLYFTLESCSLSKIKENCHRIFIWWWHSRLDFFCESTILSTFLWNTVGAVCLYHLQSIKPYILIYSVHSVPWKAYSMQSVN